MQSLMILPAITKYAIIQLPLNLSLHPRHTLHEAIHLIMSCYALLFACLPAHMATQFVAWLCASPPHKFGHVSGGCDWYTV